jgi:hypothetical protein
VAREKTVRSTITPVMMGDVVTCQCGHEMIPWNYIEFPRRTRHILWRCSRNPDHITTMLPLPKETR